MVILQIIYMVNRALRRRGYGECGQSFKEYTKWPVQALWSTRS